ncbi:MAG: preprotein translocase subunit SecA, partial [Candidatus Saccharimonadales bacterium]|nr:preprotein translocase subunit SecA [Candidatus Saccharimonadales bacterium]
SDEELQAKTGQFKLALKEGKSLDDLMPQAFAAVREAATRTLGMTPFDVQLIGGMALHEGNVAEMRTGEGKTLVATLPVYLNALEGKGVHLVTVNDYLAQRDAGWMGKVYDFMGLSVAVIIADASYIYDREHENTDHDDERLYHLRPCTRQEAYAADITYGTNNEFGFDYLRDNMVRETSQLRQRELHYAIVDEVDSILIDEARTPLIISAPAASSGSSYATFASLVKQLKPEHYELDEKRNAAALTDEGVIKVQELLGIENLYGPENVQVIYHLEQALRAQTLFHRDKNYVVTEEGEVIIVDEFTGRLMHGRRYNEGLHQAIEAKEGVEVLQESATLATISFQNYFRLYTKLAGMTGTAETEEEEFQQVYDLDVIVIPTNKPIQRTDKPDRIYGTLQGKFKALTAAVKEMQDNGQAVLVGTASIEMNELLSRYFLKAGIDHNVLNAKHHESEAAIVAKAGQPGAVTLATNIAGRGTDIVLDESVKEKGGLIVVGSERHESRRIDNQLRGRCGRQGDPGMTQFYVSAEDELMRIFGGDRLKAIMTRLGVDEDAAIENRTVSKAIENAQKKVESHNFDARKNVVQYDDVMNRHRTAVYTTRRKILMSEDIREQIVEMMEKEAELVASDETLKGKELKQEMHQVFGIASKTVEEIADLPVEKRAEKLKAESIKYLEQREKEFSPETHRFLEREIYLQLLDTSWMNHLENMRHLREGITWRSIGQRDPLVEYRREGQARFNELEARLQTDVLKALFHARPAPRPEEEEVVETELTRAAKQSVESGAAEATTTTTRKAAKQKEKQEKQAAKATRRADDSGVRQRSTKQRDLRKKRKKQRKNRKKSRR